MLYPCDLVIKVTLDFSESLIEHLTQSINFTFDSFFYNTFVSKWCLNSQNLENLGREEALKDLNKLKEPVLVYPTQYFYNFLNDMQNIGFNSNLKLGIINFPLYSSTYTNLIFLYGEAHISRKCAVVSSYNLQNNAMQSNRSHLITEKRIIKECVHEIGHLILGYKHCIDSDCVMSYSNSLEKVDKKSNQLCDSCNIKLEKIRLNQNF